MAVAEYLRLAMVGIAVLLLSLVASADSVYTVEGGEIQTFQGGVTVQNPGDQPVTVIEKTDGSIVVKVNRPNSHITIQNPQGTDVDVEIEPTADGSSVGCTGDDCDINVQGGADNVQTQQDGNNCDTTVGAGCDNVSINQNGNNNSASSAGDDGAVEQHGDGNSTTLENGADGNDTNTVGDDNTVTVENGATNNESSVTDEEPEFDEQGQPAPDSTYEDDNDSSAGNTATTTGQVGIL